MALDKARTLRVQSTEAEKHLWASLRTKHLAGWKFRRQVPLGPYVVDFYCPAARLIVELDGGQHAGDVEQDRCRTAWLEAEGYEVIRFWNNEVLGNTDGVLSTLLNKLQTTHPLSPTLPREGGGSAASSAPFTHVMAQDSQAEANAPFGQRGCLPTSGANEKLPEAVDLKAPRAPSPLAGEGRGEGVASSAPNGEPQP